MTSRIQKRRTQFKEWYQVKKDTEEFKAKNRKKALDYYKRMKDNPEFKEKVKLRTEQYKETAKKLSYKRYYDNRETILIKSKEYRKKNKIELSKRKYEYKKTRLKNDILFKLKERLRYRTYSLLKSKGMKKHLKFQEYIGCSGGELKRHLESKFDNNMTWDNYGQYWVIDHIVPLASAKTELDLYPLLHYTNLQPLEKIENIRKSDKIVETRGKNDF